MSTAMLIVNPSSGNEAAMTYQSRVEEKLKNLYDSVIVKFTEKAGDATRFAREAAENKLDLVMVMGGDGTVNEGVTGLAQQPHRPAFSFIPFGTVNDLARALGISLDPEEAVESLDRLKEKQLDIGKVNDGYFIDVVAIGTIPKAVHQVTPEQKTKFGSAAYFIEGLKALGENENYSFQMTIDEEEFTVESMMVLVAMTNSVGGFETLIPDAHVDDGKFHLIVVKSGKIVENLKVIPKIFTGEAIHNDRIIYRKFEKGKIELLEGSLVANVDGDEGDALPLTLQVLPKHLTVLVPK